MPGDYSVKKTLKDFFREHKTGTADEIADFLGEDERKTDAELDIRFRRGELWTRLYKFGAPGDTHYGRLFAPVDAFADKSN